MRTTEAAEDRTEASPGRAEAEGRDDVDALVLGDFLPYRLSVLANRISAALARLYQDRFGLSIPEWRVIAVIGQHGELSSHEIVRLTAMDKAKVSRALTRLVAQGHLVRESHPADQRTNRVRFSPAGRSVYDRIAPLARAWERELLAGLTVDHRRSVDTALTVLSARIDALEARDG